MLSRLTGIAIVVGVCVPLQRQLVHLSVHFSGLGVLHKFSAVLSGHIFIRVFFIHHGVALESLLKLSWLGVELVVVVPLVAHLHVLPTSEADSAEEAKNFEESDSLVKVQALWVVR